MSVFTSFGILFLAMLIEAFLQLSPGLFSIFYHSALAKTSRKKADDLSLYYILGVEIFVAIIFIAVFSFMSFLFTFQDFLTGIFPWLMTGIFGALSVTSFFLYFRKNSSLFIPRKAAQNLTRRAENVKTRSDALMLGFFGCVPELLFTLPLYVIAALETIKITSFPNFFVIILYVLVTTIPLFLVRAFYRGGLNLADIERLKKKNQPLFRLTLTIAFLLLAFLTISLGVN